MRSHASQIKSTFTLSVLTAAISSGLQAQPSTNQVIDEVVVRAHPLSAEGLAQPKDLAPQLGRTIEAGVQMQF